MSVFSFTRRDTSRPDRGVTDVSKETHSYNNYVINYVLSYQLITEENVK